MNLVSIAEQTNNTTNTADHPAPPWFARLDLEFTAQAKRTVLSHCQHVGPLRVQRSFYPEGEAVTHTYVLHPPGGVASADVLVTRVTLQRGAQALLTSPGAMKLYRSDTAATASIQCRLRVAENASLEWFPAETLIFDGAQVAIDNDVQLDVGAQFIGWDIQCFGRPTLNETFRRGSFDQTTRLRRGTQTLLFERIRLGHDKSWLQTPWGAANHPVVATLIATAADAKLGADALAAARGAVASSANSLFAVSLNQGNVLIARYLGNSTEAARDTFVRLWESIRPLLLARAPCPPRIWKT